MYLQFTMDKKKKLETNIARSELNCILSSPKILLLSKNIIKSVSIFELFSNLSNSENISYNSALLFGELFSGFEIPGNYSSYLGIFR